MLGCVRTSALSFAAPFVSFSQQTRFGLCPHLSAFHRCTSCIVFSANSFWAVSAHQRFPSRPLLYRFLSKLVLGCVRTSALFNRCPISIVFSANSFWAMSAHQRFPSRPLLNRFLSKLVLGYVRTSALSIAAPFVSFSQQTRFGLCPHLSAFHRCPISIVFSANSFWAMSAHQRFSSRPLLNRFLSKLILGCVRTSALFIAVPVVSFSQQTHFGLCPHLSAFHRGPF